MSYQKQITEAMGRVAKSDVERANEMVTAAAKIPGWSSALHYYFFENCLRYLPAGAAVLICGVYHGKDLKLITLAGDHLGKPPHLTGVDLFLDEPCADWTETMRERGKWESNGWTPPSMDAARLNCPTACILRGDAADFMLHTNPMKFDFIYLDTSHDADTVNREIDAALFCLNRGGILAGDDYEGLDSWGVKSVVDARFPKRDVFKGRIWLVEP